MPLIVTICPRCGKETAKPRHRAHRLYCSSLCHRLDHPGSPRRYRQVCQKDHPRASASRCVHEHVLVAEAALGKYLPDGVEVHHVNGVKSDNGNSNLVICQDHSYHFLLHLRAIVVRAGGDPNTQRVCRVCKQLRTIDECPPLIDERGLGHGSKPCPACRRTLQIRYAATRAAKRAAVAA